MLSLIYLKKKLLALLILSVFLLSNTICISQENELPSEEQCSEYITWLLINYNNLIKSYQRDKDGFENNKSFFSLYHEIGENFNIMCLRANPFESRTIAFLFEPIGNNNPIIIVNYSYMLSSFTGIGYVDVIDGEINDITTTISIGILFAEYGLATSKDKIVNDTLENAYDFAKKLYNQDIKDIETNRINEIWLPFSKKYLIVIMSDDILRMEYNNISANISHNIKYYYKDFIPEFNQLNQSLQQKYFTQENVSEIEKYNVWKEWNVTIIFLIIQIFIVLIYFFYLKDKIDKKKFNYLLILTVEILYSTLYGNYLYDKIVNDPVNIFQGVIVFLPIIIASIIDYRKK